MVIRPELRVQLRVTAEQGDSWCASLDISKLTTLTFSQEANQNIFAPAETLSFCSTYVDFAQTTPKLWEAETRKDFVHTRVESAQKDPFSLEQVW